MGDWGYLILKIAITVVVILALTALVYWLVRRYSGIGLGGIGRGRVPRLAVVDALSVDRRRRLLLVRRDNVEHLILTGGPSDVVVESSIQRTRMRQPSRTAPPPGAQSDMPVMHELAQSGLGAPPQTPPAEPLSTPEPLRAPAAPPAETADADPDRSRSYAERPAVSYRAELPPRGAIDTRQLLESISETRRRAPAPPDPQGPYAVPPQGRELRIVATEPPQETEVHAPSRDLNATKISDLEQEMARLLGQLNVKRP